MPDQDVLDELANLVAERLEQRRMPPAVRPKAATIAPEWTDRLAASLDEIYQEWVASERRADVVGDQ